MPWLTAGMMLVPSAIVTSSAPCAASVIRSGSRRSGTSRRDRRRGSSRPAGRGRTGRTGRSGYSRGRRSAWSAPRTGRRRRSTRRRTPRPCAPGVLTTEGLAPLPAHPATRSATLVTTRAFRIEAGFTGSSTPTTVDTPTGHPEMARRAGAHRPGLLPSGLYRRLRPAGGLAPVVRGSAGTRSTPRRRPGRSWARPARAVASAWPYHRSGIAPCPEGRSDRSTSGSKRAAGDASGPVVAIVAVADEAPLDEDAEPV